MHIRTSRSTRVLLKSFILQSRFTRPHNPLFGDPLLGGATGAPFTSP